MLEQLDPLPKFINTPVDGLSYYVPKQPIPAGVAFDPQPDNKPIPPIFTPLKARGLTFHNRIGVSPMVQYSADNGKVTPWHFQHYGSFATRGPGLIMAEATSIVEEGRASPEDAGIWNDELAKAWIPIVEFVHSQDQLMGIQLGHSGRKSSTAALFLHMQRGVGNDENGWPDEVYGPSAISFKKGSLWTPKELTKLQIKDIIKKYGEAAKRAIDISKFDFIEIHAAHGYLVNEFLSAHSNKRTDEYGGSFENRVRFLNEVIDEVRSVMPNDMPLFVRISASENVSNDNESWTIEESKKLVDTIIPRGVDVIDVSSGGNNAAQERRGAREGFHVYLAEDLKAHIGDKLLIATVGGLKRGGFTNDLIANGKTDLVFVARSFLKNPGLVWLWADELGVKVHQSQQYGRS